MAKRHWHLPTEEGWLFVVVLLAGGLIAGGWAGLGIMLAFCIFTNILGQFL